MEYQKINFPNGELFLPEETIDGTFEELIVRFYEEGEGLESYGRFYYVSGIIPLLR